MSETPKWYSPQLVRSSRRRWFSLGAKVVLSKKEFIFFPPPPLGYITKGLMLYVGSRLVQVKGGLFIRLHNLWGNQVFEQRFIRYDDTLDAIFFQLSGWYGMSCLLLVAYSVIGQVYDLPSFRKPLWVIEGFFIIFLYRRYILI